MGLIGPNGSGKTTLLHLILGLYEPDEGTVRVDGKGYGGQERAIREMTGVVLLDKMFHENLTLRQNADFYGKYYANYDAQMVLDYMKRFSLDPDRKYKAVSRGEELKFQFAFALSHAPRLLVLDEPTASFDPEFRAQFFGILKTFIADGRHSVIISTHLSEDLDRIADYITYLEKGNLILSDDIESIRENYRLVTGEAYKIRLLPQEDVVHIEPGEYGTRALVRHRRWRGYDREVTVSVPTIEELMYFITKRGKKK